MLARRLPSVPATSSGLGPHGDDLAAAVRAHRTEGGFGARHLHTKRYDICRTAFAADNVTRLAPSLRPEEASITTQVQLSPPQPALRRAVAVAVRSRSGRYVAGVLALAVAYYGTAKLGQSLRYTASVSAIWPPAGVGIAALYLWGLRWWPGVFVAELVVNGELLVGDHALPPGSLLGQQAGNMAEVVVGAVLLRRLIGARAALDRAEQVGGLLVALGIATAFSATVGTASMLAGGVIVESEAPTFWRTWWLGDTAGALVVLPLALAWVPEPAAAWRRIRTWQGALMIAATAGLGVLAFSMNGPVTYLAFPALIWAAFRFGPAGATLSIAIAAGVAVGFTAHEAGPFSTQPIDRRTLITQVYIVIAALTTLFLSAVVTERERSAVELAEAKRREDDRAMKERHRIARDLHDSVSQALFSTVLHTRTAQKALKRGGLTLSGELKQSLDAIGELTKSAQSEMRALIFELGHDGVEDGLVTALTRHASMLRTRHGLDIDVKGPERLALSPRAQTELFGIGREALANVVKHAGASKAWVHVEARSGRVLVEIHDDGSGFDPAARHPGHFGLESMQSRAAELGGVLTILSAPGGGTVVRVEARTDTEGASDGV
jgi:signal transduction histidine kinase